MSVTIYRRDGSVAFVADDAQDMKSAVRVAVASGADLSEANLSWANLSRADLSEANLYGANLSGADLSEANLSRADLSRADLSEANLSWANLSGADLSGADLSWANLSRADLSEANLYGANLSGADLSEANLSWANLSRADLSRANLSWANLSRADLSEANLYGANLSGAKNLNPYRTTALAALELTGGRAFKLVAADGGSPMHHVRIMYEVGQEYWVGDADVRPEVDCGAGINLCDLPWAMREWRDGWRILIAEFEARDVAVVPYGTDGKFRVSKCRIVGEVDLVEIGLVEAPVEATP